ncbi:NEDD8-activating enzyme E1 regulatory subunit AXR1-like [Rosa rugosa]|uniref:NEDD8-activating enzyme E1 regulatory subunit AXR1-like n=1 Tax=Rosa rugosa TaxID=74645 RepID=UPI002B401A33|nr:NEDD8-activating enzyme E1 regulatory subunit AXR1-like [Rosa rugosa]
MVAALKICETKIESATTGYSVHKLDLFILEFLANEGGGEAPLEGSIPDMTSSTEHYVALQKIYQAKAEADFLELTKGLGFF